MRYELKFLSYVPVIFVSAAEGQNIEQVFATVVRVAAERQKRVGTGQMNRFLERVDFERAPVPMSRRMRILYMTQAGVAPPTFVLFTDRDVKLHFSYERFLENQIREAFGFEGSHHPFQDTGTKAALAAVKCLCPARNKSKVFLRKIISKRRDIHMIERSAAAVNLLS